MEESPDSRRQPGHIETVDYRVEHVRPASGSRPIWQRLMFTLLFASVLIAVVMVAIQGRQVAAQAQELASLNGKLRLVCGKTEVQQLAARSADVREACRE